MAPFGCLGKPLKKLSRSIFHRQKPRTPPAPILKVPGDVLRCIVDSVSPADAAALALSSKSILDKVGSKILKIERTEERVELLKHLEIHFPDHVLCYQCGKFHRRRKKVHSTDEDAECDRKNGRFCYNSYSHNLPFTRAQEIMNRHRYGKRYGAPVKSLNKVWPGFMYSSDIRIGDRSRESLFTRGTERTKAKIVDDKLIIRMEVFSDPYSSGCEVRRRYCQHQTSWDLKIDRFHFMKRSCIQCPECPTEVRLGFARRPSSSSDNETHRTFVVPCTTVWCNLGHCRSPFEPEWRALARATEQTPTTSVHISPKDARYMHAV